jgi:hypothetical protein
MNAAPIAVSSAWSAARPDPVQQTATVAAVVAQGQAKSDVPDAPRAAPQPERSPPPAEGQGTRLDVRI